MDGNPILNGTFDARGANWTAMDLEFNPIGAYINGAGRNIVLEIDGKKGQTTVLEQTFTVTSPVTTELVFDVALRTSALNDAPDDGFDVEILDSNGVVIAMRAVRPTVDVFQQVTLAVVFPAADDYTLRFTEVGDDDSLGAIIYYVEIMGCFAAATHMMSPAGEVAVQGLRVGDMVTTKQGPQPLRWIGKRTVTADTLVEYPQFAPVRITARAGPQFATMRSFGVAPASHAGPVTRSRAHVWRALK